MSGQEKTVPYEGQPRPGTMQQPSGPGPPSIVPSSLDQSLLLSYSSDDSQGGWDFTFVPVLDPKYECPICLMCLREPWQTSCGHRFCKSCIQRSLREAGPRCPVDNVPLSEQTMFPDGFAKREIMSLMALCPFSGKGCRERIELRLMLAHEENCSFRTINCPNLCGREVRRLSFDEHVRVLCPKIPIRCELCGKHIAKDMLEKHKENCCKASIQCQHCGKAVLREDEKEHIEKMCPNVVVACRFKPFGCQTELLRDSMVVHTRDTLHHHVALLANNLESLNLSAHRRQAESDDYGDYSGLPYNHPVTDYVMSGAVSFGLKGSKGKPHYQSYTDPPLKGQAAVSESASPSLPSLLHAKESYSAQEITQYLGHLLKWTQAMQDRDKKQTKRIQELEQRLLYVERNSKHSQAPINRFCNGTFIWRLQNYKKMRDDAMKGNTSVQHSDGFYTAIYGYKLCIRVNINATDTIRGAYISLFVHFMKGEYDNIVDWPFKGCISLSILDQTEESTKRKHLRETLIAKSELLAFHRPTSYRNHKGFGYMEFAPLSVLENGSYIKNDSFYIKVEVNNG